MFSFNDYMIIARHIHNEYDLINLMKVKKDLNYVFSLYFEPTTLKNIGVSFPNLKVNDNINYKLIDSNESFNNMLPTYFKFEKFEKHFNYIQILRDELYFNVKLMDNKTLKYIFELSQNYKLPYILNSFIRKFYIVYYGKLYNLILISVNNFGEFKFDRDYKILFFQDIRDYFNYFPKYNYNSTIHGTFKKGLRNIEIIKI